MSAKNNGRLGMLNAGVVVSERIWPAMLMLRIPLEICTWPSSGQVHALRRSAIPVADSVRSPNWTPWPCSIAVSAPGSSAEETLLLTWVAVGRRDLCRVAVVRVDVGG
jgi:hypothetical protein